MFLYMVTVYLRESTRVYGFATTLNFSVPFLKRMFSFSAIIMRILFCADPVRCYHLAFSNCFEAFNSMFVMFHAFEVTRV